MHFAISGCWIDRISVAGMSVIQGCPAVDGMWRSCFVAVWSVPFVLFLRSEAGCRFRSGRQKTNMNARTFTL